MGQLSLLLLELFIRFSEFARQLPVPQAQRWKAIQKGMNETSAGSVTIVSWVLGIVLCGAALFAIINTRRERIKRREREQNYFLRKAAEKELDQQAIKFLTRVVQGAGTDQPYRILDSFDIYQHALETYEKKQRFSDQEHKHFHQAAEQIKDQLGFTKIEEAVPLATSHDIKTGQVMRMRLNKDGQEFEYEVTLLENEDKFLTLDASKLDLEFVGFDFDVPPELSFHRETDAGYHFSSTIAKAPDKAKKKIFLKHPAKLARTQARNFSRMEVTFPFSFYHLPKDRFNDVEVDSNLEACGTQPNFRGETVDISGGGLAFSTRRKIRQGDFLYLNFQLLSDDHNEPLLAEAVWSDKDKEHNTQLVRAKFYSITEKMQDELMKFVYQMQRRFARKLKYTSKR